MNPPPYSTSRDNLSPAFESKSDLVIAIDFGTTFSGVAYAHESNAVDAIASISDMKRVAEKVTVVRTWPNQAGTFTDKTPTVLAYNSSPPHWGTSVQPNDKPTVAYFKLGLQENVSQHYADEASLYATTSMLGGYLMDHDWKHPDLPQKKAVDFTADYLTCLIDHILTEVLPLQFGADFLKNQKLSYVITVPAIWSDKAKELTRQAAVRAGIARKRLTLITEPEAAAAPLCAQTWIFVKEIGSWCVMPVVDLISYKVVSLNPFGVEECSVATGATCGAVYLEQSFEALLRKKLGPHADTILTPRRLNDLLRYFDTNIKRNFNPLASRSATEYEIAIGGVADIPEIGLEDGYLTLTRNDIQGAFDPIFNQIIDLIKNQMDIVQGIFREKMKTIFLVGGLGSNAYFAKFLDSKFKSIVEVKQPDSGVSAIMRGAVLYKLSLDVVKERIMPRNYGVSTSPVYRPNYHRPSRKYVSIDGVTRCKGVMDWYATKGQKLANGTLLEYKFKEDFCREEYLKPGRLDFMVGLWVCDDEIPPEYDCATTLKLQRKLVVNLRDIPAAAFYKGIGPYGEYYGVEYELGLVFGPGGIEFKLMHEGKVVGCVDCDYN